MFFLSYIVFFLFGGGGCRGLKCQFFFVGGGWIFKNKCE